MSKEKTKDAFTEKKRSCRMKMEIPNLYGRVLRDLPYENEKSFFIRQNQRGFPYKMRKSNSIRQVGKKSAV